MTPSTVVKDKEATLAKAHAIADDIIALIQKEITSFNCEDDPAEHSYLAVHVLGNLNARIAMIFEGYATIYAIEGMTANAFLNWIEIVTLEYLKLYQKEN